MGMSAGLATSAFAIAIYEYRCFQNRWYSLGIAYWGLMELLQAFQHIWAADASDNYAMCSNEINQLLTDIGIVHVVFQPLFSCMLMMSMFRKFDPEARIQADLIWNMCFLAGCWFMLNDIMDMVWRSEPNRALPATKEHPNYTWLQEGYDGRLGMTTPNIPGTSCTYYAPTETGHLAWAVSMYHQSYHSPGGCVHCFCLFAPFFAMYKKPFFQSIAVILWLSGPFFAYYVSKSVNEQPAIWCLYSVIQVMAFVVVVRTKKLHLQKPPSKLVLPGVAGEETLTYVRVVPESQKGLLEIDPEDEEVNRIRLNCHRYD